MLTIGQILIDDPSECRIEQEAAGEAVEQGGEPADGGHGDEAAGADDTDGFLQGLAALGVAGQVIEGAEEQNDVERVVGELEVPGIADVCRDPPGSEFTSHHLHVTW